MINQIRIRAQFYFFTLLTFNRHTVRLLRGRRSRCDDGRRDGLGGNERGRTLYSSSDLEGCRQFLDEDVGDDGGEEDPKAVGEDPIDEESVPVVVARLAPSTAEVLYQSHVEKELSASIHTAWFCRGFTYVEHVENGFRERHSNSNQAPDRSNSEGCLCSFDVHKVDVEQVENALSDIHE